MLTIDQIEVIRGPVSLLYGSSAVGGVVNVVTDRIHQDYVGGLYGKYNIQGETAQPGASQSILLNYGMDSWMIHLDASSRNLGELQVPDYARTAEKRSEEPRTNEQPGEVTNSFNKQQSGGLGVSRIFDGGHLGVSYSYLDNNYGTVSETDVTIDMEQKRLELHFSHELPTKLFSEVRFKTAQADYKHIEFEGTEQGTVFTNKGNESRIEIDNNIGNLTGISGFHTQISDFSANGDEAFLPSSKSVMLSAFTLQEYKIDSQTLSSGFRFEDNNIEKETSTTFGQAKKNSYSNINGSLGHQYKFSNNSSLNQSFSYTERAPTAQELFSNGAHIASSTFERGNENLKKERALAYEVNFKRQDSSSSLQVSAFYQHFKNFIALAPNGQTDSESNLPVYNYLQLDANFFGFEASGLTPIAQIGKTSYSVKSSFDYVRAKATGSGGNLARITPMRLGTGLQITRSQWQSDLDLQYVFKQDKIAQGETATPAYLMLDLSVHYDFIFQKNGLSIYAKLSNILDEEARNHISTIKDLAPLPGRNFVAGIQGTF